jgi:thiamine biosynthesis lipoprotein
MIVPIEALLGSSTLRRIRRALRTRHGEHALPATPLAMLAVGWLALHCDTAAAGWVGDAMDLMGTRVSVELWADDDARGRELVAEVMEEYKRIDREMSTYKPDSEISLVNDHAAERPMKISAELFSMVDRSLQLSAASHGAFDITYDSVGYLYDFRAHKRPTDDQIAEHLAAVDYRHVVLDAPRAP